MSTGNERSKYSRKYTAEEIEREVLSLLEDNSTGLNINDISRLLEINRNTISKWLNTLEAKNKIISRKIGVSNLFFKVNQSKELSAGPYIITFEIINKELKDHIENMSLEELKSKSFDDLKINFKNCLIIRKANNMYLNRVNEVEATILMKDLFDFYPFKDEPSKFDSFLFEALVKISKTQEKISKKISIPNEDGNNETFLIKVLPHGKIKGQFDLDIQDLTLLRLLEEQLINSETVTKILNLIADKCITIQSQDDKVIMANELALKKYYNGLSISFEVIKSYDFFNLKNITKGKFVGQKSLISNTTESDVYTIAGIKNKFTAIPIKAQETNLEGYILLVEELSN